jgi:hypothetical protein
MNAQLGTAQAAFDWVRNGPRPNEIAVGEFVVGYSQARPEEAEKKRLSEPKPCAKA